jgi:hypothetical protein
MSDIRKTAVFRALHEVEARKAADELQKHAPIVRTPPPAHIPGAPVTLVDVLININGLEVARCQHATTAAMRRPIALSPLRHVPSGSDSVGF